VQRYAEFVEGGPYAFITTDTRRRVICRGHDVTRSDFFGQCHESFFRAPATHHEVSTHRVVQRVEAGRDVRSPRRPDTGCELIIDNPHAQHGA
jgi:hypothetical protein